jgi:hypothetical protein
MHPLSGEYGMFIQFIRPNTLPQVQWSSEETLVVTKRRKNRNNKSATPDGHVQSKHSAKKAQLDCSIMFIINRNLKTPVKI